MRKPRVLHPESRDYGNLTCPKCGASTILRLGTSNVVVWDYKTKEYVVIDRELPKDGMLSPRQFKATFLCQKCSHQWSIISGV